jgi:hypothetical protein
MWWCKRGPLLGMALLLAGCGFHPLYAPRNESGFDADLASIRSLPLPIAREVYWRSAA